MSKPMPKPKRLLKTSIPEISRHESLRRYFGNAKPRFFSIENRVFALGRLKKGGGVRKIVILGFNREKNRFGRVLRAGLYPSSKGSIEITSVTVLPKKFKKSKIFIKGKEMNHESYASRKTGLGLFRLVLKEAISYARETGLKKLSLYGQNKALEEYYERFGFKREDKSGDLFYHLK